MKDFPLFPCEAGMASLILREIPYKREAYVLVRSVFTSLDALLRQCAAFCREAGAEAVYASGVGDFSEYPLYTRLLTRSVDRAVLPACTLSVQPAEDLHLWAREYNRTFAAVPLAKTCDEAEIRALRENHQAMWVCDGGRPVGLGRAAGDEILCLAALQKGRGSQVLCALAAKLPGARVCVTVAETNAAAMRLYDRAGFDTGIEKSCFYVVK